MKFAHMADLHLGGWRDSELGMLNQSAFERAIELCIGEKVDFILMSGDFFDTSMPSFDVLDFATRKLGELREAKIPVYTISGSHDFSPSGKTILKVFENAGLIINVSKGEGSEKGLLLSFTEDEKTGAKIAGIFGRKGSLDEEYFSNLDRSIEKEEGYKIFMFHSGIREYLPEYLKDAPAMSLSLMPRGFDYYAGGHIHHRSEHGFEGGKIIFPGPIFPCDFPELERFGSGGFYIVEDGKPRFVELKEREVVTISIDADNRSAKEVEAELEERIISLDGEGFILLIKVRGTLSEGKPTDIAFRRLSDDARTKGALVVRRNTNSLSSREYEEIKISSDTIEGLEEKIIKEHAGQSELKDAQALIERLIHSMDVEKSDGETSAGFEERIISEADRLFEGAAEKKPAVTGIEKSQKQQREKTVSEAKSERVQMSLSDLN